MCKAPDHDTPGGWTDLIEEARDRLMATHPNRSLSVVFGIGPKGMIFIKWHPMDDTNASPLQLLAGDRATPSTLRHPELRYDHTIPGQSHVLAWGNNTLLEAIDTTAAYSLDYWTQDQRQIIN